MKSTVSFTLNGKSRVISQMYCHSLRHALDHTKAYTFYRQSILDEGIAYLKVMGATNIIVK